MWMQSLVSVALLLYMYIVPCVAQHVDAVSSLCGPHVAHVYCIML